MCVYERERDRVCVSVLSHFLFSNNFILPFSHTQTGKPYCRPTFTSNATTDALLPRQTGPNCHRYIVLNIYDRHYAADTGFAKLVNLA